MSRKLLVVQVAAFGWDLVGRHKEGAGGPVFRKAATVFPAVTCTVQASFRTALGPAEHGMAANGLYFRDLRRVMFWEQSADLVRGPRIWDTARARGQKVGLLFWQQSLGESADVILSPRPVHKHHGGMIQDCYSRPADLYARLAEKLGPFNLMNYWGPLASVKVNDWIVAATVEIMRSPDLAPDLLFTYLPGLDYDLQRWGPESPKSFQCLEKTHAGLSNLWKNAEAAGYDILVFGDYAIEPVTAAVFPNRALREAGLLNVRTVRDMAYADLFDSPAFALADHQVAQVFVQKAGALAQVRGVLEKLDGVGEVLDTAAQDRLGIRCPRSGELVLVAQKGRWFAYPWWTERREAPDYATHVDIHNKPGYDPCELFFGWPPMSVSQDTGRVRGSHGRVGAGCEVAWASSFPAEPEPDSVLALSQAVRKFVDGSREGPRP